MGEALPRGAENLQPVFAQGWPPLLQAAAPAAAWYAETAVLGFLLPFRGRGRGVSWRAAAAGLAVSAVLVSLVTLWALAVFGPLAARVPYAIFQVTRAAGGPSRGPPLPSMPPAVLRWWRG